MTILKTLHRAINEVEELQDAYSEADNARLVAEIQRDELLVEVAALRTDNERMRGLLREAQENEPLAAAIRVFGNGLSLHIDAELKEKP